MLSLRDPEGGVFEHQGRIYRWATDDASVRLADLFQRDAFLELVTRGLIIETARVPSSEIAALEAAVGRHAGGGNFFEHRRVAFPTYPFEWHPLMLADAALATIEIAEAVSADGFTLKDATPFNILFEGTKPVHVDILSLELRGKGKPLWLPEAQFVRTFLLPLMAYDQAELLLKSVFLNSREGLAPSSVRKLSSVWSWASMDHWLYAVLPSWLEKQQGRKVIRYEQVPLTDAERGDFIYQSTLKRLRTAVTRQRRKLLPKVSHWSAYTQERAHYSTDMLDTKRRLVDRVLGDVKPSRVLDIGANTGEFAELAASHGASVVALEFDLDSIGVIYNRAREQGLDITPLHMNYASPSPATGWLDAETRSFRSRVAGHFDCVLMLAVIHHLVVTEGIRLRMVLTEVALTTRDVLIIEHVDPLDPMVQLLLRGRDFLAAQLEKGFFEKCLREHFDILQAAPLQSATRTLYVCRKRHRA